MSKDYGLIRAPNYYIVKGKQMQEELKQKGINRSLFECASEVKTREQAMDNMFNQSFNVLKRLKLK